MKLSHLFAPSFFSAVSLTNKKPESIGSGGSSVAKIAMLGIAALVCGAQMVKAQVTAPAGYDFGSVALGQSAAKTVTFSFTGSITVGSVSVVTQGATGQDYQPTANSSSGTLCTAKAYTSGQSCTVDITFAPLAPGVRSGAAVLRNGSNQVIGTGYVTGNGSGAQLGYTTPTVSTFVGQGTFSTTSPAGLTGTAAGFIQPTQIAFDAAGNLYMTDGTAASIYKVTPGGLVSVVIGQYRATCGTTYDCGYPRTNSTKLGTSSATYLPQALMVDGAGQLWFTDNSVGGLATVDLATDFVTAQVPGKGTAAGPPATSGNIHTLGAASLGYMFGIASDGLGNVYVSAFFDGTATTAYTQILKLDSAGNISVFAGTATPYASGSAPADGAAASTISVGGVNGMGFDAAGNFYYYDQVHYMVYKIDTAGKVHPFAGSGSIASDNTASIPYWMSGTTSTFANTSVNLAGNPGFLTVDPSGNVYLPSQPFNLSQTNLSSRVFVFTPAGVAYVLAGTGTIAEVDGAASGSALSYPTSVALNGTGDIYISETYGRVPGSSPAQYIGASVRKWSMGASTTNINFGQVAVGSTSAGQTVTATNVGNAPLVLTVPASGSNPSTASPFVLLGNSASNACGTGASGAVAVYASCSVVAGYQPHAVTGTQQGSLTFAGNVSSATSTVSLSGTPISGVASLKMTGLPASSTSGASNSVTVSALDVVSNIFSAYTGTVHFSVSPSDVAAALPSDYVFKVSDNGTKVFPVALSAPGAHTVTVTDTANAVSANQSTTVAAAVDHFTFTGLPTTAGAGAGVSGTLTAYSDAAGLTVATSYTGPVTFTSTDANGVLPAPVTLVNGVASNLSFAFRTAGVQTITAVGSGGSPSVTSGNITVRPGALSSVIVVSGTPQSALISSAFASPLVFMSTDAYGNAVPSTTVTFTVPATGASATLSASSVVTGSNGQGSVTATANGVAGTYSVGLVQPSVGGTGGPPVHAQQERIAYSLTNRPPPFYTVTTTVDNATGVAGNCTEGGTADANCSLRDALAAAAVTATSAIPITINFSPTVFKSTNTVAQNTITLANGATTTNSSATLLVGPYTTIQGLTSGSGATLTNLVTIDGGGHNVVLASGTSGTGTNIVPSQNVVLANLNIVHGSSVGLGGGVVNYGTMTVTGSTISGNSCSDASNQSATCPGSGIVNQGSSLTIDRSTVANNSSASALAAAVASYSGVLTITNSTIAGNSITQGIAAGVLLYPGRVGATPSGVITNSTISGNTAGGPGMTGGITISGASTLTMTNSILSGNTQVTALSDCAGIGCPANNTNGNVVSLGTVTGLSALGNYGGPTQTMLPLPNSAALCKRFNAAVTGVTGTDQRGFPRTTDYSGGANTCADAGAVQSNYGLAFVQQPTNVAVNAIITPSPSLQLTESGTAVPFAGVPIAITALSFTVQGTLTQSTGSNGVATFPGLSLNTATTFQSLQGTVTTANLPNVAQVGANVLSAPFNVVVPVDHFVWSGLPTTVVAGVGFRGTITAYADAAGLNIATAYNGLVSFTGSLGGAQLPSATAMVNGVLTNVNFALTSAGPQTITVASIGGSPSTVSPTITVTPGAVTAVYGISGDAQSAAIGAAFTNPLVFQARDAYSNPVPGATVVLTVPATGASATLSATSVVTGSNGQGSVTARANATAGGPYLVSITQPVTAGIGGVHADGVALKTTFSLTNTQAATSVVVTPSTSAIAYGQPVTVNAAITPASVLTTAPTGSVTFFDGATAVTPNATVANAAASLSVAVPTVGTHAYSATYLGDTNFAASAQSASSNVVVSKASTTLTGPATQPVLVTFSQSATIPVSVAGQFAGAGIAAPSGSISYTIPGSSAQTSPISAGVANIVIPNTLAAGPYAVTVSYAGDANYAAATGITVQVQVGPQPQTITFNPLSAVTYGVAPITLSATATSALPVVFTVKSGPGSITGSTLTVTGAGAIVIAADQAGSAIWKVATTVTQTLTVNKATPAIGLATTGNIVLTQNAITFTATVSSTASVPTGPVNFLDGTTVIGSGTLVNGVATYATSTLAIGSHSITAVYAGDGNFNTVTSAAQSETIEDFSLNISTTGGSVTSVTILPGGTATYSLTISPINGTTFPAVVNLSASGLPTGAVATFTPSTLAAGSGTTTVTLTITVPQHAMLHRIAPFGKAFAPVGLGLLLLPFSRRMRKTARTLGRATSLGLLLVMGFAATIGLTGCGASTGFFGQQQQTYNILVTGTSGTLTHSTTVTLTVE